MKYFSKILMVIYILFPAFSLATTTEYSPLTGLDWLKPQGSMEDFFNELYLVSIFLASTFAVFIIAINGFFYMIQDVNPSEKKEYLKKIKNAFLGLVLLLAIHLILYKIDPEIVSLKVLK